MAKGNEVHLPWPSEGHPFLPQPPKVKAQREGWGLACKSQDSLCWSRRGWGMRLGLSSLTPRLTFELSNCLPIKEHLRDQVIARPSPSAEAWLVPGVSTL